MAATVETYSYHGAGGSGAQVAGDNIRYKLADNNTQDENNKNVRPAVGTNLSFWKVIALVATVAPGTGINNIYLYTDGALAWADCTVYVADDAGLAYDQATGSATSGDDMNGNYVGVTGKTDFYTYTSGSPKTIGGSIGAATGKVSDYVPLQMSIGTSAVLGQQASETYIWQYDES